MNGKKSRDLQLADSDEDAPRLLAYGGLLEVLRSGDAMEVEQ